MNVQRVTPILNVSNLEESFAWFEKLGWKKHWDYGDPPDFGAVLSSSARTARAHASPWARSIRGRPVGRG